MINNKKALGFTLIELMIVVAIIGILGAIAYPNYSDYVKKGRRADAQDALTSAMQKQEVFYANNAVYATNIADLGLPTATSLDGYYTLAFVACGPQTCAMTATPTTKGGQNTDKVSLYSLSSTGLKTAIYSSHTFNSWTNF